METAKKNRTQQRRLFTKACNEFDAEETNLETSDKIIKLKIIEEKAMLMINSEDNVKEFLFSDNVEDDVINKEIDESESYIDRWRLLELLVASIGTRLVQKVIENLKLENIPIFFGLTPVPPCVWIKVAKTGPPFVYNGYEKLDWRGKPENLALCAWIDQSGGIYHPEVVPFDALGDRVVAGPAWLYYPSDKWPRSEFSVNEEEVLKEKRKEIVSSMKERIFVNSSAPIKCRIRSRISVSVQDLYHLYTI
ncbi:hypothetical protein HNY73_011756 [Argiope bruennichi]|uniref:Uncharacterized protein n=1 Tax=Argiope bruennichi TaxID=94029 RepID=A0A8T0ET06_ARGBR|nr:hypothetical protein HNY73_011756 [Argiope bruennichi]